MAVSWNDELNEKFRAMRLARTPVEEMAAYFGTSVGAIYAHSRVLKVFVMARRPLDIEGIGRLKEIASSGQTDAEMATALDRPVGSIRWYLGELGFVGTRRAPAWKEADYARLQSHVTANKTTAEIAVLEGISISRARARLKEAGVKARRDQPSCRLPRKPRVKRQTGIVPLSAEQCAFVTSQLGKISLRNISAALRMSSKTLNQRVGAAGLVLGFSMRHIGAPLTEEVLRELVLEGLTARQAGQRLHRDGRTVAAAASEFGLVFATQKNPVVKMSPVPKDRVVPPKAELSQKPVARIVNLSSSKPKAVPTKQARRVLPRELAPIRKVRVLEEPKAPRKAEQPARKQSFGWMGSSAKARFVLDQSEVDAAVARFVAERGVNRGQVDVGEAAVTAARRLGFQVLRDGDGFVLDSRIKLASLAALQDFVAKREGQRLSMTA